MSATASRPTVGYDIAGRREATATIHLPLGIGNVSAVALATTFAAVAGVVVWWSSGAAVAMPLALVGGVALAAALEDTLTGRIPNSFVLAGIVIIACSWGFVATLDNRLMRPLVVDMAAGLVLSGAPAVFLVWLVVPRLIGGGDWKLLSVLGLAVGELAPTAAAVIPLGAFGTALVAATVRRRRQLRLGPFLTVGYAAAIVAAAAAPDLFGSAYGGMGAA